MKPQALTVASLMTLEPCLTAFFTLFVSVTHPPSKFGATTAEQIATARICPYFTCRSAKAACAAASRAIGTRKGEQDT